jgi:uncharacterized protein YukE
MAPPTSQEVKVATDALRTEANVWDHQSDQMHAISTKVAGLRMTRLEAGIFQVVVGAYDTLVDQVSARCQEGHDRMHDIAATLRPIADTYDTEDAKGEHRLMNLY